MDILRLDLIHPEVSGNKWFKLKYNLQHIQAEGYKGLLTFGGAYSNHLTATAAAAKAFGVPCVGIVRGDELHSGANESLRFCADAGMELRFVTRAEYDLKYEEAYWDEWRAAYPDYFIVPEGGNNALGKLGTREIAQMIPEEYDTVAVSVGTGTTLAGLLDSVANSTKVLGFAPMKKGAYIAESICTKHTNWDIVDSYHFGGFGKHTAILVSFMNAFFQQTGIPLDKVYTAKMLYGVIDMVQRGIIDRNHRILVVHTGGLQGNNTIKEQLLY